MRQKEIATLLDGLPPISGLEITPGFQCHVSGCSLKAGNRSQNYRTIIQYMKKDYQLPQKNNFMIKNIGLQLFFPPPKKKLFSVSLPGPRVIFITLLNSTVGSLQGFLRHLKSK